MLILAHTPSFDYVLEFLEPAEVEKVTSLITKMDKLEGDPEITISKELRAVFKL